MTKITSQGLTVTNEDPKQPIMVMAWGIGRQPVHTAIDDSNALRIAAELIEAVRVRAARIAAKEE